METRRSKCIYHGKVEFMAIYESFIRLRWFYCGLGVFFEGRFGLVTEMIKSFANSETFSNSRYLNEYIIEHCVQLVHFCFTNRKLFSIFIEHELFDR